MILRGTGFGPSVDISAGGEKVIWCDGAGEIFIANFDGSDRLELATLLPNPNPDFADLEPIIRLPPRITSGGEQVFFIHADYDPRGAGVWRVDADDSGLTQIFNYNDMAEELFGTDTVGYNFNTAFANGFDISADGSRMIFGTTTFKLGAGDMNPGGCHRGGWHGFLQYRRLCRWEPTLCHLCGWRLFYGVQERVQSGN